MEGVLYEMVPPPAEYADAILAAARSWFTPTAGWPRARVWRWTNPAPACRSIELDVWGQKHLWDVVVWSSGKRAGVELLRVSPPVPPAATADLTATRHA